MQACCLPSLCEISLTRCANLPNRQPASRQGPADNLRDQSFYDFYQRHSGCHAKRSLWDYFNLNPWARETEESLEESVMSKEAIKAATWGLVVTGLPTVLLIAGSCNPAHFNTENRRR